jgi:lysophospholipase L1-like esterase
MHNEYARAERTSRRSFLSKTAAAAVAAVSVVPGAVRGGAEGRSAGPGRPGGVVLFQGDSITDAGRDKKRDRPNDPRALGRGYAMLVASHFLGTEPQEDLKFYNRGISGNKVPQLAERWGEDCLAIKPDVLSVLIGVNDLWHKLNGRYDGTIETYERDYRALLKRTRQDLPGIELVICEPFVLRCGAVNDDWFPAFDGYRAAARRVAEDFRAVFVPFQAMFDEAVKEAPPEYWAGDGVHPTMAGSYRMARCWVETVTKAKG